MTIARRNPHARKTGYWMVGVALVLALALDGCGLGSASGPDQGGGLPALRRLDWGFTAAIRATYSPDGRWVALLAGPDTATGHLEVVSPDGRTRYDLTSWDCGTLGLFDFAWLPDDRLACVNGYAPPVHMCLGAAPFQRCSAVTLPSNVLVSGDGASWAPDGSYLIVAGTSDGQPLAHLLAVSGQGTLLADFAPPDDTQYILPAWVPTTQMISYMASSGLVLSTLTREPQGLVLGSPQVLIPGIEGRPYAWSPSGVWVAVRYANYRGGDRIYLVNRANPKQTVDVVEADQVGQQMDRPIWSPDGKTLIVFGVNDNQPYAIDIATYLHSKGLEV